MFTEINYLHKVSNTDYDLTAICTIRIDLYQHLSHPSLLSSPAPHLLEKEWCLPRQARTYGWRCLVLSADKRLSLCSRIWRMSLADSRGNRSSSTLLPALLHIAVVQSRSQTTPTFRARAQSLIDMTRPLPPLALRLQRRCRPLARPREICHGAFAQADELPRDIYVTKHKTHQYQTCTYYDSSYKQQ